MFIAVAATAARQFFDSFSEPVQGSCAHGDPTRAWNPMPEGSWHTEYGYFAGGFAHPAGGRPQLKLTQRLLPVSKVSVGGQVLCVHLKTQWWRQCCEALGVWVRNGTPKVGSDPTRGKFLVKLRVSIEAIVVRHYPVGKGFLVRLKEEAKPPPAEGRGEGAPLTRPPYLFIKIWSEKHEANNTGFVNVRYDLRDTGFKIDPEKVIYHPDGANEYNKQLIVWEAKMKQATREKAESEVLAAAGMKTMVV